MVERWVRAWRPSKLLHVFPSFARGGQQMRLAAIASQLGSEFIHHVISLDDNVSACDAFDHIDVEIFHATKSRGVSPANVRRLAGLVSRGDIDILCTYNFGSMEAVLANALGPRRPHVHFEDGFGPDEGPDHQKFRRVMLRRFALRRSETVVPSRVLETVARTAWHLPAERLRRIPNGIDLQKFAVATRARHGRGQLVVGSVGALRPEKNFERLIRVFTVAPRAARLCIYGDGPERERLSSIAAQSSGDVVLKGETKTPEKAYREFDIFALSSNTEQMPLSLLEAMAAGLPVIATDVGDVKDMLAPENRPFVAAANDERAYVAALESLLSDAGLRARLGEANADKARREFGLEKMAAAHLELYQTLIAQATSR